MRTPLTANTLKKYGFKNVGKCNFKHYNNMHYWVKNCICLFYNAPVDKYNENSFYIGYANQIEGEYVAVAFRWINTVEELTEIYESIIEKDVKDKNR